MVTCICYRIIILYILSSLIQKKIYRTEKKVKARTKPLLWDANYDRKNNDYTKALRPRRFKWFNFSKKILTLLYVLDTFRVPL